VLQNALSELIQLRGGFDPEFLDEMGPRLVEGSERFCLSARSIQGEHVLMAEPLAEGMFGGQAFEFGDETVVSPESQFGIDPVGDGVQAELVQSARFGIKLL
jgi:hypothetical protein